MSRVKGRSGEGDDGDKIPSAHMASCLAIKAVTGGSEEEIYHVLKANNYDVDLTTNTLIDNPFETFQSKGKKKKGSAEAKKAMPKPPMAMENKRPMMGGRGEGGRGGRGVSGGRGGYGGPPREGGFRPGGRSAAPPHQPQQTAGLSWDAPAKPMDTGPRPQAAPANGETRAPLYSRMPATDSFAATPAPDDGPAPPPLPAPAPIRAGGGGRSMAELLKGNSNPPPPPPANSFSGPQDTANASYNGIMPAYSAEGAKPKANAWTAKTKTAAPTAPAAELANMSLGDEKGDFGDFGGMGGFGDGFGDGFAPAAAPADPIAPAAPADPAFSAAAPASGFQSYSAPPATSEAEKAADAPVPPANAPPQHDPAQGMSMPGAVPPYYGGMQPYSFIGIPGMPSAPGYPSYGSETDQGLDMSRLSQMQYAQDPSGMAHAYGQQQQAATAASDGKEGAPGSGPPPVPPPASGGASAAGVAGPHPSQQAPHMQMHAAYAGLPPGMAPGAQYGHMYPTYPYAMPPNTGYHYMHSPYSHYAPQPAGAAYAPQAGSTYAPSAVPKYGAMPGYKPPAGGAAAQLPGAYASYAGGQSGLYPQAVATTAAATYGDELQGGMPTQHRGQYKESGLYIPGQQGVGGAAAAGQSGTGQASGGAAGGQEGSVGAAAPSSYYGGAYGAGQGGYAAAQGQYAAQYAQGQYWQNAQVLMQQGGVPGSVAVAGQAGATGFSNKL